MTPHHAFFGDGEYAFALTPALIVELERKTGVGIGALFQRVIKAAFGFTDITETIRLALIGGGMSPERAQELVETYASKRPLAGTYPRALAILESVWFGAPQDQPNQEGSPDEPA